MKRSGAPPLRRQWKPGLDYEGNGRARWNGHQVKKLSERELLEAGRGKWRRRKAPRYSGGRNLSEPASTRPRSLHPVSRSLGTRGHAEPERGRFAGRLQAAAAPRHKAQTFSAVPGPMKGNGFADATAGSAARPGQFDLRSPWTSLWPRGSAPQLSCRIPLATSSRI